jgi:hypothetical protein
MDCQAETRILAYFVAVLHAIRAWTGLRTFAFTVPTSASNRFQ